MVHYTCDMCGKPLLAGEDIRYVVKIEVYSTCDDIMDTDDLDEELWEMEDDSEDNDRSDGEDMEGDRDDEEYRTFRFDLCHKCHKKYLQDPLFLKSWNRTRFSEN
ncbi:MAG: hypothetical protein FJ264_07845 [Planctomycetes bacterium]|nr:hypothetical protein [Planctomycetota bacterium]